MPQPQIEASAERSWPNLQNGLPADGAIRMKDPDVPRFLPV
jgi:hypothetical protein